MSIPTPKMPEADAIGTLLVAAYAFADTYGLQIPKLDLEGSASTVVLLVVGAIAVVGSRLKARLKAIEAAQVASAEDIGRMASAISAVAGYRNDPGANPQWRGVKGSEWWEPQAVTGGGPPLDTQEAHSTDHHEDMSLIRLDRLEEELARLRDRGKPSVQAPPEEIP